MKKRIKWDFENLQKEALKYNTRVDFQKKSNSAYISAWRMGILNTLCSHMKPIRINWNYKSVCIEALKCKTRSEFQRNNASAYMYALTNGILEEICSHMPKRVDQSGENNPACVWTKNKILSELKKYSTINELLMNNKKLYLAVWRRKDSKELFSIFPKVSNSPYSEQQLAEIALKYNNRIDFVKKHSGAYQVACRLKIIDKICSHMKPIKSSSYAEREILYIIKSKYPSAKKIRHTKIKIDNKPHIHRFDIDIFIPELNLGIEYDGKYYHDFKGLKRGRKHWPDEDICNYHEIKDQYFLTKGIKVLHIKGADWDKNKEDCIKRCFEFLRGNSCQ